MKTLFIDIETFGHKPERSIEVPELILPTRDDVKIGNIKDSSKIDAIIEEKLPQMIADAKLKHQESIVKANEDYDKEWRGNALKSLSLDVIALSYAIDDGDVVSIIGNEELMFNEFSEKLFSEYGHQMQTFRVVAHNGNGFDFPIIRHRAMKYGLNMLYHLFTDKRYSDRLIDTQDLFRGSDFKNYYSMDSIAKFFGIQGKGEITGKDVHDLYLAGKIGVIAQYCGDDVEVLRNIYYRMIFK